MANLTMLDVIKSQHPDGSMDKYINPLSVIHKIFLQTPALMCNNGSTYSADRIVARATASEYAYGQGTAETKDTLEIVTDITEGLESTAAMDRRLIERFGPKRYTDEEQRRFAIMLETASDRIFNGNPATNPLQIRGLYNETEYSSIGDYVYDNAGGNASVDENKTSLWAIQMGEGKFHLTYPQNVSKIVRREFTAKYEESDSVNGGTIPMQKTRWNLDFGKFVHDLRCVARVANISCSSTPNGTTEVSFDEDVLVKALMNMPDMGAGAIIFAPITLLIQMVIRANSKANTQFEMKPGVAMGFPISGEILSFMGKPVVEENTITITEGLIS